MRYVCIGVCIAVLYVSLCECVLVLCVLLSAVQFADQYLEMSTALPLNPFLYGLGEHVNPFRIPR